MLLNYEWVKNEIKEEIKSSWKQMKMNIQQSKTYGTQQRQSWEEVHNDAGLPKKKKKIETFQNTLTLHLQNSKNNKDSPEQVEGRK